MHWVFDNHLQSIIVFSFTENGRRAFTFRLIYWLIQPEMVSAEAGYNENGGVSGPREESWYRIC